LEATAHAVGTDEAAHPVGAAATKHNGGGNRHAAAGDAAVLPATADNAPTSSATAKG
jgi:hypothetical protein